MMLPWLQYLSMTRVQSNMAYDAIETWMKEVNRSTERAVPRYGYREGWIRQVPRSIRRGDKPRMPGCCTISLFVKEGVLISDRRAANRYLCNSTGS